MSRYRKTFREAMAEVELNEVGYLQPRLNDKQIANIKNVWKHKTKKDITPAVKKMIANMDVPTQLAIKHAGINQLSDLIEGRMSDIDAMRKQGASAAKIAKELGLDVKAVKAILGEQDSAQDMQDVKKADKIKEDEDKELDQEFLDDVASNTPNEEQFDEEEKKKKTDVAPEHDSNTGEEKSENSKEKLEKEVEKKDQEIAALKQKAETDKAKAIKKDTEKMVNPETGEPLLQIGLAYKHMRDKIKKEMQKEEVISEAGISPAMIATLKREYEPFRGKRISAARAQQLMNILNKFKDSDLQKLSKENIPFISTGAKSKLVVRGMKFTVKDIKPFGEDLDEEMFEACWTGYKQVGMKNKGGKQVPNCVPEETILDRVNEMAKDKAYAIGMSVAKKKYNDEPPLDKKTITKGHEIADKLLKKEEADLNELGSFSKIYTKKSMRSHPSKKAEYVFYKGLVKSINVGSRDKPPKRDTEIGIIGRDGSKYYAQGEGQAGLKALGKFNTRQDALKAVFNYSVKSKQIKEEKCPKCGKDHDKNINASNCSYEEVKEFKKMTVSIPDKSKLKRAFQHLNMKNLDVKMDGEKIKVDGTKQGRDLNKFAIDLKNFYGATVKAENAPSVADINRLKKQGLKPKNEDHPAREVYESIAAVRKKAEKSGMPYGVLKKVYDRGMAAWRGGHRPGATQVQWALARVNSFVTKSSGTWGGADKDLAKQVRGK